MNPYLIGFANIVLPGLGYLILKKRVVFGWLLLVATIAGTVQLFIDPLPNVYLYGSTPESMVLGTVALVTGALAFGYDAYTLAKE